MSNDLQNKIISRLKTINRAGMDRLIDYICNKTDYFEAPASTKFHSNFKGGLAVHSDNVVEILLKKNEEYNLGLKQDSIYIIGYLHDLCKCNMYKETIKLRKNNLDKWEGYKTFSTEDELPLGHGEKSVILIQQFIKLSLEETMCIRWHMGAYLPKEDYTQLNKAIEKFKSVLITHIADLEASHLLEEVLEPEICSVEEYNAYIKEKNNI